MTETPRSLWKKVVDEVQDYFQYKIEWYDLVYTLKSALFVSMNLNGLQNWIFVHTILLGNSSNKNAFTMAISNKINQHARTFKIIKTKLCSYFQEIIKLLIVRFAMFTVTALTLPLRSMVYSVSRYCVLSHNV